MRDRPPSHDSDAILRAARASLNAQRGGGRRRGGGAGGVVYAKSFRLRGPFAVVAVLGILLLLSPLLLMMALALGVALVAVAAGVAIWLWRAMRRAQRMAAPVVVTSPDQARGDPLPELAGKTALWLNAQRIALPAPAQGLADQIGARLSDLGGRLGGVPDTAPEAAQLRKLLSDDLPELITAYAQVPPDLRATPHAGTSPDAALANGLSRIAGELDGFHHSASTPAMDRLAVHSRYLDYRYGDGGQTAD
ncbi:hypothetical protein GTZ99_01340 [Novosphingobium sp. FSY-8]|uniref:Transmembrane protein n=1 Tax=Novosphingobium ovatum TaxID=1908523 RepID=A0ABW9X9K7_9SPHN|nr:hypothetical protein [Novosphingobium ovatum]NBC35199.1 hypothetical protein [Novosphingobium ovatum]